MTTQKQSRDSFIFYRSFYDASRCLKTNEKAQLFDAICSYALDEKIEQLEGTAFGMFQLVKPQLDANRKRYINGLKGAEHGSKGGRPIENNPKKTPNLTPKKPQDNPKITPSITPNENDNVNLNDNVNVNEECKSESINDNSNLNLNNNIINQKNPVGYLGTKDNPKKTDNKRFTKPTIQELISFCNEFALNIDPQQFIDYYDANGWKINKNPMKDWQATARNWHRRNADKITTTKKSNIVDPMDFKPSYDYEF